MSHRISVFDCDHCGKAVSVKTDEDWKAFERDWWQGLKLNFCSVCCQKPETQQRRLADVRWLSGKSKEFLAGYLETI